MTTRLSDFLVRHTLKLQFLFVGIVLAGYVLGGSRVGKGTMGLCLIFGAVLQQLVGKIPYGWEGAQPSGYLTGWKAFLFNVALACIGVYFVLSAWTRAQ